VSKGDINISISGGSANIGNIAQGDNNTIDALISPRSLQEFQEHISELQRSQEVSAEQVKQLRQDIEQMLADTKERDLAGRLKVLYEKYSWAIVPLKKLFSEILS
jgi:hypothetical protein